MANYMTELTEVLKTDKGMRQAWEANIAMAFKDQFHFSGHKHEPQIIHEVANKAAAAFIDQLIGKDMGEVDGMLAVAKLHQQTGEETVKCEGCEKDVLLSAARMDDEDANWWCPDCVGAK